MAGASRKLIVEARDLDTDERVRYEYEFADGLGMNIEAEFEQAVERTHPGAKPRSLHEGVASFLDRQHLIVAYISSGNGQSSSDPDRSDTIADFAQEALFSSG